MMRKSISRHMNLKIPVLWEKIGFRETLPSLADYIRTDMRRTDVCAVRGGGGGGVFVQEVELVEEGAVPALFLSLSRSALLPSALLLIHASYSPPSVTMPSSKVSSELFSPHHPTTTASLYCSCEADKNLQ